MSDKDYVLGTHDAELARLGLQHQLWRAQAYRIWERARFGIGARLVDVGCGPGFATRDLAELVGESGHVTAVDASEKYVLRVNSLSLPNVQTRVIDVQNLDQLSLRDFDGAYARWVLCFVPDPQRVIDGVAKLLKPGGRFAIQDYYNYTAIKLAPRSEPFERVIAAVAKSWRDHGGDCDVASRLPGMLERSGLRVTTLKPIVRLARPNDSLWQWPATFFKIFVPTLVQGGYLTEGDRAAFEVDWTARSNDPSAFFTSPPMVDLVGEKR